MESRYCTSIHEAGHAVIGRVLGLPCGAVTINPGDVNELGHAIVSDPIREWERGDGPRRPMMEASCVCLYAGGAAERIICGGADAHNSADQSKVRSLIEMLGVRAASFVGDDVWERYEAVYRGTLHADEIDELMRLR